MNQRPQTSLLKRLRRQAEQTLDKLAQNNFGATKARSQSRCARGDRRFKGQPPLLIYTMGKVGSSSVLHSLKLLDLGRPLYRVNGGQLVSAVGPDAPLYLGVRRWSQVVVVTVSTGNSLGVNGNHNALTAESLRGLVN